MGRKQVYRDATERQRAHRARAASVIPGVAAMSARTKLSRPARLRAVEAAAQTLLREYQDWLDRLPESLEDTTQAELLSATIDTLEQVVDLLADLNPPRGFGRD